MKFIPFLAFLLLSAGLSAQNDFAYSADKSGDEKHSTVKKNKPFRFDIKNNIQSRKSEIRIELSETTDSLSLELFDEFGQNVQTVFEGKFPQGKHIFSVIPKAVGSKPYIAILKVAGKVEAMKLVKFSSL